MTSHPLKRRTGPGSAGTAYANDPSRGHLGANMQYDDQELEFLKAVDLYKRINDVTFIPFSELLFILHNLGYRKTEPPTF